MARFSTYLHEQQIPPTVTWSEYENREFADIEVVYSSMVYCYDTQQIVAHGKYIFAAPSVHQRNTDNPVLNQFLETGSFGDNIIESCDAKLAIWTSLLPACKKDPLQRDGRVDEVMYGKFRYIFD